MVLPARLPTGIGLWVWTFRYIPYNCRYLACVDAHDPQNSPIFKQSDHRSGIGGWGDPSLDYTVTDGGFSDFHLTYPSPHILRRNWTAQPWLVDAGVQFVSDPAKYANASITPAEVEKMVGGFVGNFTGFQSKCRSKVSSNILTLPGFL